FIAYAKPYGNGEGDPAWQGWMHRFVDPLLAWGCLLITLYFAWQFEEYSMAVALLPIEVIVCGAFLLVALFEVIRRIAGIPLVGILLCIMAYGLWGSGLPSLF